MNEERFTSIENRLTNIENKFSQILAILTEDAIVPSLEANVRPESREMPSEPETLIEIPAGEDAPWIAVARTFYHKDEIDDNAELQAFLGIDPAETPWCAYFVDKCLEKAGCKPLNSGLAADFAEYGQPCEECEGAIAVFDGHVGFVVANGKILGGNQGDMVRENNLAWYHANKKVLGYRFPDGYVA